MPTKVMHDKSVQGGRGFAASGALASRAAGLALGAATGAGLGINQDQNQLDRWGDGSVCSAQATPVMATRSVAARINVRRQSFI